MNALSEIRDLDREIETLLAHADALEARAECLPYEDGMWDFEEAAACRREAARLSAEANTILPRFGAEEG